MVHPQCCNPFNLKNHKTLNKHSRAVSAKLVEQAQKFLNREILNERICDKCSRKLYRLNEVVVLPNPAASLSSTPSDNSPGPSERISPPQEFLQALNQDNFSELCVQLGGSPLKKHRLSEPGYVHKQLEKMVKLTCENVLSIPVPVITQIKENETDFNDEGDLLNNIVQAFNREEKYDNRVFLLSLLPVSWSVSKVMDKFQATRHIVIKSKNLIKEAGYGSFPVLRKTRSGISSETVTLVEEFYRSMDISRQLPGTNDCISVRDANGVRIKKQKLLVLCNLSEAYQNFLEKNPTQKIGFSKFAELRPRECILAGKAGTHNECVCIIHQNNNLLCPAITKMLRCEPGIKNERDLLKKVSCENLTWGCCEDKCENCNMLVDNFLKQLKSDAEAEEVDDVTYSYWKPDYNTYKLEKITSSIDEIIEILSKSKYNLAALRKHDYITKEQSRYLKQVKNDLTNGEYAVILDFSENYKFITQNEIQAAHYYTQQATLFPIVAYYKSLAGEMSILSYAVISEELTHDVVAVYGFQTKFINFLRDNESEYPAPNKIYYFSDGAVSQFKNRNNFANINFHQNDFNIDCEWNFFATSHGKGPSDGVGGTIKRTARICSLRSVEESLFNTAEGFFEWCKDKSNMTSIHFGYVSKVEYAKNKKKLNERFSKYNRLKNIRQTHQVMPGSDTNSIKTKMFSSSLSVNISCL